MSSVSILLLITTFIFILSIILTHRKKNKDEKRQPPGPPGYPVIGNLLMLGKLPHRTLQTLAIKYGPIMSLRLGQIPTVVVSSSEAAKQFLKTHDVVFANRPTLEVAIYVSKGVVLSEYGAYWRYMRKVCTFHLLSASKVESFAPMRKKELEKMVKSLKKASMVGEVVNLSEVVHNVIEDFVYKMVLGRTKDDEFDLKGLVRTKVNLVGAFNLSDYVPWLAPLDLQGFRKKSKTIHKTLDQVFEKIIAEHEHDLNVQNVSQHKDFVDILLSLMHQPIDPKDEQSHVINRTNIKAILLDMIAGAFDTSATAVEWALSELIRHPRVMKKLQDELDKEIGRNNLVEEKDLVKLSYLDIVIKETLRLYPPGPLVPRESNEDVIIDGYFIEKKSRILVNLWAIGRDSKTWSDNAEMFYPERFIDNNLEYRGNDLEFIPFSFGRRGCPGMHSGLVTVKLVVAQLVHCFSWELPQGSASDDLDMTEKFGLTIPRVKHLLVGPKYRLLRKDDNEPN